MSPREIQRFDVGIKAFFVSGEKLLVAQDINTGRWEFPGGRIDVGEEHLTPEAILRREISEELGPDVQFNFGGPVATWIVPMVGRRAGDYAFLIGYQCEYLSGELKLSAEHQAFKWVDKDSWKELEFIESYIPVLEQFWKA